MAIKYPIMVMQRGDGWVATHTKGDMFWATEPWSTPEAAVEELFGKIPH